VPFLIYSALRLLLLGVTAVVLYVIGLRGLLLAVLAIVIAAMLSFLLLRKQANATAVYFDQRRQRRARTIDRVDRFISEDAAAEDEAVESRSAASPDHGGEAPHPDATKPPSPRERDTEQ